MFDDVWVVDSEGDWVAVALGVGAHDSLRAETRMLPYEADTVHVEPLSVETRGASAWPVPSAGWWPGTKSMGSSQLTGTDECHTTEKCRSDVEAFARNDAGTESSAKPAVDVTDTRWE